MKHKPNIYFCGDVHGKFDHFLDLCKTNLPDAIIFLGDIQAQRPLHQELSELIPSTQIWWIHGNHDTDSDQDHDHLFGSELRDRNLHGRVVDICGVRVAGLGGVFRGQIWKPPEAPKFIDQQAFINICGSSNLWRGGLPRKHRSTIFLSDVEVLAAQHADILVTHEAPSIHRFGFEAIEVLANRMGASQLFHGHQHEDVDYSKVSNKPEQSKLKAYGVGFRGIMNDEGVVLVPSQTQQRRLAPKIKLELS